MIIATTIDLIEALVQRLFARSATSCVVLCCTAIACTAVACTGGTGGTDRDGALDDTDHQPLFVERAAEAGIDFVHQNGATGRFYYPELMQGGAAFLDFDNDDDLDIYLVQSGDLPATGNAAARGGSGRNRLYRNRGDRTFEDATAASGLGDLGYGSGVAVADYDQDGWLDVYVTNLGPNRLYRNRRDGTFEDVTAQARVGDPGYSTGASFFDADGDGDLDLYVANYVAWSPEVEKPCLGFHGLRGYCSPSEYSPARDTLYRNLGEGVFADVTIESGMGSAIANGLGVIAADLTGDGLVDIYVANDQMANFLWANHGDGRFVEEALLRGAALNEQGHPEAGMGLVAEDFDSDGDLDLFITHLSGETNTFYGNQSGNFRDLTDRLRLGGVSQPYTGFGVGLYDFDLDGHRDLFIANGKVSPGDSVEPDYAEPNQILFGDDSGHFRQGTPSEPVLSLLEVSRGAAFGDFDNDGDIDVLVNNNGGPARLFDNRAERGGHWLAVELRSQRRDRDAVGSRIEIVVSDQGGVRRQVRFVQPASSYCSSNDPRVHFGLGDHTVVDLLRVTWPDGGTRELTDVSVDRLLRIDEELGD